MLHCYFFNDGQLMMQCIHVDFLQHIMHVIGHISSSDKTVARADLAVVVLYYQRNR